MEPGELAEVSAKAGASAAGYTYVYFGMPLSQWVAVFTIVYLVCQVIVLAPKVIATILNFFRKGKDNGESNTGDA